MDVDETNGPQTTLNPLPEVESLGPETFPATTRIRWPKDGEDRISAIFPQDDAKPPIPLGRWDLAVHVKLYLERPREEVSRVYARLYTVGPESSKRNHRVGTIPDLRVRTKHWKGGVLSMKAPLADRKLLEAVYNRVKEFQAEVVARKVQPTAHALRRFLWQEEEDIWTKLRNAASSFGSESTSKVYGFALRSFQRHCEDSAPTAEAFQQWGEELTRKHCARTVNTYIGGVRSCLHRIGVRLDAKGLRVPEPNTRGGIALSDEELNALLSLQLEDGSALSRHRDALICACITSLRLSDWRYFGTEFIGTEVRNTKTRAMTPMPDHPLLRQLIERNGGSICVWKKPNSLLKKLGKMASEICPSFLEPVDSGQGAKRRWEALVSHVGRRTHVSSGLQRKVDPFDLMRFTGHASIKQLMHYNSGSMTPKQRKEQDKAIAVSVLPPDLFMPHAQN